jgi:hypothetical protein
MERLDRATTDLIEQEVKGRFPDGTLGRVAVIQYGDDPAVEPGEIGIRVAIEAPAGTGRDGELLDAFKSTHKEAFAQLRRHIRQRFPQTRKIEFVSGADPRDRFMMRFPTQDEAAAELTPVMARLGPADLETLDTLITAGIAGNRAQAVRWTLARIRERPAYAKLRERAREIEELKSQF